MIIETAKAFATAFGASLIFLAAFTFTADDAKRKVVRLFLLVIFGCAIGNLASGMAYGYRPIQWPAMMFLIAIGIAGWLSISHHLLRRRAVDSAGRPILVKR